VSKEVHSCGFREGRTDGVDMSIEDRFDIRCRKCGGEAELESDSSGCNDPECCGGATYSVTATCKACKETETEHL
jgi:hypothetical protein